MLNNQEVSITEATFKKVYREMVSGFVTPPTAHSKFNEILNGVYASLLQNIKLILNYSL